MNECCKKAVEDAYDRVLVSQNERMGSYFGAREYVVARLSPEARKTVELLEQRDIARREVERLTELINRGN